MLFLNANTSELLLLALFFAVITAVLLFLIQRNCSDKKELESTLNRTYRGSEKGPADVETDAVTK